MKRKGFTLIELLAVIVVLSIVALIATVSISGVIENSRKKAFEDTGYGIIDSAEVYYAQHTIDIGGNMEFSCNNTECKTTSGEKLNFKGNIKGSGTLLLFSTGKTALCLNDGKYTIIKNFNESAISLAQGKGCLFDEEDLIFNNMKENYTASDLAYMHEGYDFENVQQALDVLYPLLSK